MQRPTLAVAEAGTSPGMWAHMTWFHCAEQTGPSQLILADFKPFGPLSQH